MAEIVVLYAAMKRYIAILASVWFALFLLACKGKPPAAGAACEEDGQAKCIDKKNAMVCAEGKWEKQACRSNTGCMVMGRNGKCTNNNYEPKEACFEKGKYRCTPDKKAMIFCEKTRWEVVEKCLGPNGCVSNAKGAKCDMSFSEAGAPCRTKDTFACTLDKTTLLRCDGEKLTPSATCPGRHKCRKSFNKIECDGKKPIN